MHTTFLSFEGITFNFNSFKCVLYFASSVVHGEVSKPLHDVSYANFRCFSYSSSSGRFPSPLVCSSSISQWLIVEAQTCTQVCKLACIHHTQTWRWISILMDHFLSSKGSYMYIFSRLETNLTGINTSYFPLKYYFRPLKWNICCLMFYYLCYLWNGLFQTKKRNFIFPRGCT